MEKKLIVRLSMTEKFKLFLHTHMCDGCRLYEKQSHFLDNILRKHSTGRSHEKSSPKMLPDSVKYKIVKELDKL
jgi:hypothetical protein